MGDNKQTDNAVVRTDWRERQCDRARRQWQTQRSGSSHWSEILPHECC